MLHKKEIKILSVILIFLFLFKFVYRSEAKPIPGINIDTYTITLNGSILNDIKGLNIFVKLKDNKAAIKSSVTFSSNGATSILSSITGPDLDLYTISVALNGKITNGQAIINGNFVEGSILPGAEFEITKVERDGGIDITSSLTINIEFKNSKITPTPTVTVTPTPTVTPTSKPTSSPFSVDPVEQLIEELGDKETIDLSGDFDDLNTAIINGFFALSERRLDITSVVSVEITNAPEIPEGLPAAFELPEVKGLNFFEESGESPELPKGFSLATDVLFENNFDAPVTVSDDDLSGQNAAVLVDADGKTFVVGFGFLRKVDSVVSRKALKKNYRFQTEGGEPLELKTTVTVPVDAARGDAKVSILNKNESLATIPLRVGPPTDVQVGKKQVGKPQIGEPVKAIMKKSGRKLTLNLRGENFIKKIAIIDGKLEKLVGKANFTNVTFVPPEGIKIKSIKVRKKKIKVKAEIQDGIESGIKLFNVITPKGADIGAVVFPEELVDGMLEATSVSEDLILGSGPGSDP